MENRSYRSAFLGVSNAYQLTKSLISGRLFSLPSDLSPGATSHTKKITQERRKRPKNLRDQFVTFGTTVATATSTREVYRCGMSIGGMLPDNILLEIFDFYRTDHGYAYRGKISVWRWHLLVHVCRRWRQVIFESPQRLELQIFCTNKTPVRKNLGVWPAFPIDIRYGYPGRSRPRGESNVIAALRHPDRVRSVTFDLSGARLGKIVSVMHGPFPVLTHLDISSRNGYAPVLPAGFLGMPGSTPRLRTVNFYGVSFPALPKLLLTASDLVELSLRQIPPSGYIAPEAMASSLAALPRLEIFCIMFTFATPRPNRIRPPVPITRTVLPALTSFGFRGTSEYLEHLVAHFDAPQLDCIRINYLNQLVDFQVAQLFKFIDRSAGSELALFRHADVQFFSSEVALWHSNGGYLARKSGSARISISCKEIDWQVSHMAQVLSHFSVTLSAVVHLNLVHLYPETLDFHNFQLRGMDHVEWQHLLRQFSTVRTLRVDSKLAPHVAIALEDITMEMAAEVLPSLDLIHLGARFRSQPALSIKKFVDVCRLSGRPVTVIGTRTELEERRKSYVGK